MKLVLRYFCILFLVFSCALGSQTHFNLPSGKSAKIKFQLIDNIIIIPVELNGVKLSFLLDTGVSQPILFNLVSMDSLYIKNRKPSYLRGLGNEGSIEVIKSTGNFLRVGDALSVNQEVSIIFDEFINFTPRLGLPVHGIIGYDIFKDFIVEVNYSSKYIRLYKHKSFKYDKYKKWASIPIKIHKKKPYLKANVNLNAINIPVTLLIDSGGSDALWLFENSKEGISVNDNLFFEDFLGKGLSGDVYGKRSKIKSLSIGKFIINNLNVAYPDTVSLSIARNFKERNGSISGNLLKRFNIFYDYKGKKILLKKNSLFKAPFHYNNGGIILEQNGFRSVKQDLIKSNFDLYNNTEDKGSKVIKSRLGYSYILKPAFQVVEIRKTSNAYSAGIRKGDVIISVNNKKTSLLSLQQVNKFFHNKKFTSIKIEVKRNTETFFFNFKLDDVFNQKKSLQTEDSLNN